MGKTETIKERSIYVYLPTPQMVDRWKDHAARSGQSISKFVVGRVEDSIMSESEQEQIKRSQLYDDIKRLNEVVKEKDSKIRLQEALIEKYEQDLRSYRERLFNDESFTGVRTYDKELMSILRESGVHSSEEIIDRLRVKPADSESMKAIRVQLENLQRYGIVKETRGGWIWNEQRR